MQKDIALTEVQPSYLASQPGREKILDELLSIYKPKQRLRPREKRLAKVILSVMQGFNGDRGRCELCKKVGNVETDLQIHHVDGIVSRNEIENLRLMHQPCNVRIHHAKAPLVGLSEPSKRERKSSPHSPTELVKILVDYTSGSPEMQANNQFEPEYRNWLIARIRNAPGMEIEKKEAINAGAEAVGCNPKTSRPYYDKMVSSEGPCYETKTESKIKIVKLKDQRLIHDTLEAREEAAEAVRKT